MGPRITAWEDLIFFHEDFGEKGEFRHATFVVLADDDDVAYFGKANHPRSAVKFVQLVSFLAPIPDGDLVPEWAPYQAELTKAPDTLPPNIYIKRPDLVLWDIFREHDVLNLIPKGLLEEAKAMEIISRYPHPNIIRYHGCRVRRGCVSRVSSSTAISTRLPAI